MNKMMESVERPTLCGPSASTPSLETKHISMPQLVHLYLLCLYSSNTTYHAMGCAFTVTQVTMQFCVVVVIEIQSAMLVVGDGADSGAAGGDRDSGSLGAADEQGPTGKWPPWTRHSK